MLTPTFNDNNDFPISVEQIFNKAMIYPNPFTEILYLEGDERIEVRNFLGQLIYSAEYVRSIQTSDWDAGVYFIYLRNKNQTLKVIKI